MKATIIYDNTAYKKGLRADWGFSCVIEVKDTPTVLFDTGANGMILLNNMRELGIDPFSIGKIVISHAHGDHTGGLSEFLTINRDVTLYVPPSFSPPEAREVITVKEPLKIDEDIYSTGELSGVEQSLVVKTKKGLAVIVGCSHPGIGIILDAASAYGNLYALIGGFHGFRNFSLLENLELICPTHCTKYTSQIRHEYPERCIEGGVGQVIEI
ncbi:MAG: MBL fold metallo-hydrolase [Euryarchaeota archaeon]|nr:MBL fold metallo-hydrolase [Euryarchaeota archaeon]